MGYFDKTKTNKKHILYDFLFFYAQTGIRIQNESKKEEEEKLESFPTTNLLQCKTMFSFLFYNIFHLV